MPFASFPEKNSKPIRSSTNREFDSRIFTHWYVFLSVVFSDMARILLAAMQDSRQAFWSFLSQHYNLFLQHLIYRITIYAIQYHMLKSLTMPLTDSKETDSGAETVTNLLYSEKVVIHQGENAQNVINIINRRPSDNGIESPGVEITGKDGKGGNVFKVDVENDKKGNNFSADGVKEVMKEIALMQVDDQSQLRTLIFILTQQVKMNDGAGYSQTREKINEFFQSQPDIQGPFRLATELVNHGKEFEAVVILSQLIAWEKYNTTPDSDKKDCLDRMTKVYMSLARDAALQLLHKKSTEKKIYRSYLIELMLGMLIEIGDVKCSDTCYKACCEALGLYYVACVHVTLCQWKETYAVCDSAIKVIKEQCQNPKKRLVYANVTLLAGMTKYYMNELRDAEKFLKEAIEVFEVEGQANKNPSKESNVVNAQGWLHIVQQLLEMPPTTKQERSSIPV